MRGGRPWHSVIGAGVLVLVLASCASENKTGSENVLDFKDTVQKGLGEAAESPSPAPAAAQENTAPAPSPAAPQAPSPAAPARTQAPAAPPKQAVREFVITINSDTSSAGSQFTPSVARVFEGQVVTWKNEDSVARSVVEDTGAFTSPSIPPGGTFEYTAKTAGTFSYHDGTRPYAVASLEVLER